ncbi:MAG: S8 family serine peptidase [Pirellulales bacterium]
MGNQSLNMSAGTNQLNGSALPTQFIDWSARTHDVLYVISGFEMEGTGAIPTDNFNGITVAYSSKQFGGNVWDTVSGGNVFVTNPAGDRTFVDILAPGAGLSLAERGSVVLPPSTMREGTSLAAPHVTGTVALLHQHAAAQAGQPRWNATRSRRHEVMKAVLMNSADKIIDNGTFTVPGDMNPAPPGTFLGMEKTIFKEAPIGNPQPTWFDSQAYDDDVNLGGFVPLDNEMGTGQLNAKRALQQYKPGEYDANGAAVPNIGWDFGNTTGAGNNQKYVFAQPLTAGMFVSITLAWDRRVDLDNDAGTPGAFNAGDTFTQSMSGAFLPENDDQINDLDIYLLPQGAATTAAAIASSNSAIGTVEHMFFRIPTTGNYEFWVSQFDQEAFGAAQDYAVAWWYGTAPPLVARGDYNGDTIVDRDDYDFWKLHYGEPGNAFAGADGNGDGIVNAADYTVWRNALAGIPAPGSAVPEPGGLVLLLLAVAGCIAAYHRPWSRDRIAPFQG